MHSKVSTAKTIIQYMAALSSCKKYIRLGFIIVKEKSKVKPAGFHSFPIKRG